MVMDMLRKNPSVKHTTAHAGTMMYTGSLSATDAACS